MAHELAISNLIVTVKTARQRLNCSQEVSKLPGAQPYTQGQTRIPRASGNLLTVSLFVLPCRSDHP